MHTAVCTFGDRDTAERAVERLLNAGFSRRDVHLQHRQEQEAPSSPQAWGVEREIAVGPRVVDKVASFFGDLFGQEHPHRDAYTRHVHDGRMVVVVDATDEPEADRARALMRDMKADHLDVVHRPAQRPLRDLLARTPAHVESPEAVQAAAHGRSTDWTDRSPPARPEERAFAQGEATDRTPVQADRAGAAGQPPQRTFDFGDVGRDAGTSQIREPARSEPDRGGAAGPTDKDKPGR